MRRWSGRFCLLLGLGALLFRAPPLAGHPAPAGAGRGVLGGAVLAYIVTPHDLSWHLHTSVDRVVFQPTLVALLLGTIYLGLLLDHLPWRAARPPPPPGDRRSSAPDRKSGEIK